MTGNTPSQSAPVKAGTLLIKGSAMQFAAFSANFFAGFLIMPFLIHHLGERGYGFWAIIGTIVGQLGILDAGLMSTTMRFLANALARKAHEECRSVFSTSMAIFWGIGGIIFLSVSVIAALASLWLKQKTEVFDFQVALMISGLNLALQFPFSILQGALAAKLRSDAVSVGQFATTFLRVVLTVAAVKLGYGIIAIALANLISALVERAILIHMIRKHVPEIWFSFRSVTWKTAKELIAFGRFVFLKNAGDAARYRLHNLIIAAMIGISAVTHYSVAIRLADYFFALIGRVASVSSPVYAHHFTRGENDLLQEKFLTLSRIGAVACCVFASGAVVFGRSFIRLWLGPSFSDSYVSLAILIVGMFFSVLQLNSQVMLRAIYKHAFDAKINAVEIVCNLVLLFALIPKMGIVGAAIATAVPMIIIKGLVLPLYICRTIGLPPKRYYGANAPSFIAMLVVSIGSSWAIPLNKINNLYLLLAGGIAYSAILSVILLVLLPKADKTSVIEAIGRDRICKIPGGRVLLQAI